MTYSGISLNLVGKEHSQVEFLGQLLQSGEELIQFLPVKLGPSRRVQLTCCRSDNSPRPE